jgi:hypothetical protein
VHPKAYQDENGHADGKRYYIEDGIEGIADQVTPGDKDIVFEHIGCFGIEEGQPEKCRVAYRLLINWLKHPAD